MDWKKLLKLLYPPLWVILILVPVCTAALILVFIRGLEEYPVAYVAYIVSFYTLTAVVMYCIKTIPKQYKAAKQKVYDNPVGEKLMTDMGFRTHVTLYGSLGINLFYVAMNAVLAVMYRSYWFMTLALYYTILAVMRFLLVRYANRTGIGKNRLKELRRSRMCGIILLAVNLVLSGTVLLILYQDKGYQYHGMIIYVMAAYTFWITAMAIRNLVKFKKLGSPLMSMAKIINMAAALVSMLSLETAMFSEFGAEMSVHDKQIFIILTGAGISIVVITMSIYSIVKNSKEIRLIMESDIYE